MNTPAEPKQLRTWTHLSGRRRKPSEYEIVSTRLHYHTKNPEIAWELDPGLPMNEWYRRYRSGSRLRHPDWDVFRDPEELVYRTYNVMQNEQEVYVEGMLDAHDDAGHDSRLDRDWVPVLKRLYTPSRYLAHTVQMASAYLSQMAPASTITNCSTFQAADAMRWLSHVAYRTRQLAEAWPETNFALSERNSWEEDEAWQGFRELMERVLVVYDWGETFVALNLVAKPAIDEAVLRRLPLAAASHGDRLLPLLAASALRDSERSWRWSGALVRLALENGNRPILKEWIDKWLPLGSRAVEAFSSALPASTRAATDATGALSARLTEIDLGT